MVLRYCHSNGIKVVPRGAGTSLSGGALPLGDGVLLGMARFNRIREVDFANRVAVAEPGVTNRGARRDSGGPCQIGLGLTSAASPQHERARSASGPTRCAVSRPRHQCS